MASVVEHRVRRGCSGCSQVGVGEHHVGALAAELEGDGLDLTRAALSDADTDLRRAGEHDLRYVGVGHEPFPDDRAAPGENLEDVLRKSGLERQLTDPHRGEWSQLSRLQDDCVAGREGGSESPPRDRHGEVPGHDDADNAERLPEGDVDTAGDGDLVTGEPLRGSGVVGQHVADVAGLPAGVADGVAGVGDLELCQLLDVVVNDGREPAEQACPVARRNLSPGLERSLGPGHRGVGLLDRQGRDGGDGRRRDRVDDVVHGGHIRSKLRTRSQSVTERSKASTSIRPMFA